MFELTATTRDGEVWVAFPNGDEFAGDDPALARRLSDFFGRAVLVASAPPPARFSTRRGCAI